MRARPGWRLLSNDHLIVFADPPVQLEGVVPGARLSLTSLPTLIPVKIGTFLDLEGRLPEPWDVQGLEVGAYRAMPVEQRRRLDIGVLYTYRRLGQDNPILTTLDDQASVAAVLPDYVRSGEEVGPPVAKADPVAGLRTHLRTDWPIDPRLNQRHLPRVQRSPAELAAHGAAIVAALAERASVINWRHAGDPSPLLQWTDSMMGGRR